jgi:hypothetical protein
MLNTFKGRWYACYYHRAGLVEDKPLTAGTEIESKSFIAQQQQSTPFVE